jgi:hypothetical protein
MGIFKKPRLLIIGGILLLAAIVLTVLFLPKQPHTVGFFGLDRESAETLLLQECLEDSGYNIYYAETAEDLHSANCKVWIVRVLNDEDARQVVDAVGEKAIFISRKPSLSQPVRFAGWDMEAAGKLFAALLGNLPLQGDTNEDGIVSCLLLTGSLHNWETIDWQKGLREGIAQAQLPVEILDTRSCILTEAEGGIATQNSLSAYGRDIEVILSSSEVLSEGAAQAITQGGWVISEDIYLLSLGHTQLSIDALNNQLRSGLVYGQWADFNQLVLSAVADTVDGEDPQDYLLPFAVYHNAIPLQ